MINKSGAGFTPLEICERLKVTEFWQSLARLRFCLKSAMRFLGHYKDGRSLTGFTLIEMVIAIFFITVGTVGAFALIQRTLTLASISSGQLTASYLAQEGIEIVRNIRDSNWLEQRSNPNILWDDGLGAGDWEADYTSQGLTMSYLGNLLSIDANGFYGYSLGNSAKFKRKIIVAKPSPDLIRVSAEVYWDERGRTHKAAAQSELTNWR